MSSVDNEAGAENETLKVGGPPVVHKIALEDTRYATQNCIRKLGLSAGQFELLQIIYILCLDTTDARTCITHIFTQAFETLGINEPSQVALSRTKAIEKKRSKSKSMQEILRDLIPVVLQATPQVPKSDEEILKQELYRVFPTAESVPKDIRMKEIDTIMGRTTSFAQASLDKSEFRKLFLRFMGRLCKYPERYNENTCYLVLGWFPRGAMDPKEKILNLVVEGDQKRSFFQEFHKTARGIRGWRRFFSLKSLKAFGLYECDVLKGTHVKIELRHQEQRTLSLFMTAYNASHRRPDAGVDEAWVGWVREQFNKKQRYPTESAYSLELIYGWSPVRLTIAVVAPTLFSFLAGLVYMIQTDDVQTAWTISSYIVTAAGAIVALLGILGALKEG
ncbi:hypothetical protein PVAG01_08073 [Phlyctema vagabunda]|uniref:Transmembrane protein n=1 Tax=Phlyctema vagabunda TaxID=108571 RepID=A0ABR4P8C7_9HELO